MDKKRLLKKLVLLSIIILIVQNIYAQNQNIVSKFEKIAEIKTPTLKISFHSWGEGKTELLNLDQYFPVKRDPNSRYVYLTPPEISVRVDQDAGIAYLTAFKDWTGTKEIIFSLTDIYNLETVLSNLQSYRKIITQQRAPLKLKQQFEDLPSYHLFEKVLDDLESKEIPSPRIEVTKVDNNVKVSIGDDTNLELDLQTLTEDNLPTLKPKIAISIQPEKVQAEEQEGGLSILLFIPLILIILTLVIIGIFYIKNNKEKLKKHFKKSKPKPTQYNKLIEQKRELSSLTSKLEQQPIKESVDSAFAVIKNFFNAVTPEEYQFAYSEIKKEQLEKGLSEGLKDKLCKFSKEISDIRFSGKDISKSELKEIIRQAQQLISGSANEEKSILAKKEHEKLKKQFPINAIKYVLDSFTSGKEVSLSKIKERIDVKKKSRNVFHKLGIIRSLAERELARKRKYLSKVGKIKEKEQRKQQEKKKREEEKRRKKLLKLKKKQQKEHLKLLDAQRRIREIQRKEEEKRKGRLERARKIRDFFHDRLGLFKTVKDLEKELEEKRKKRLEKERIKRAKKRLVKRSILNFLHFLRLYRTQEEKHEKELILKKEERLKRQQKERRLEARKQAVLTFLHALKLYRTSEEVEKEKERRLRKLRDKQRKKEEKYQRKEKERQEKRKKKQNEKLKKLEEKRSKKHEKILEIKRKEREKKLAEEKRKDLIKKKKAEIKKYLRDKLGLFRTLEEKEYRREQRYKEKLRKQKIKEQKRFENLKRKEEYKLKKQKAKEKKIEFKREAEIKKQKLLQKQKEIHEKERKLRKESVKRFLHKHFGLYKTKEDIQESIKDKREKLEKEISQKQQEKKKHELAKAERKTKIEAFLHNKFGLFKTRQEIEKSRIERREHRIELEHKIEDTVLKSIASRFERKNLSPEQEIKILMGLEQEALQKGDTAKSRDIQKKINKIYKKIKKVKSHPPSLLLNKLRNSFESARDSLFSSVSKLDSMSPFIRKINTALRDSLSPKIENAKLDQINYLISNSEIELKRNKKEEAKEYYKRAVYLYRSLNRSSRSAALPILLKIKNEITSTAIADSMEKAFGAIYTGQIKKAEKIYKNIDANFSNVSQSEREKMHSRKEELYQKIAEQKIKTKPVQQQNKISISQSISRLFRKKEQKKFYPLTEERFKPVQQDKEEYQRKEEKASPQIFKKKETIADFIMARKPKFSSIKVDIKNQKYHKNLLGKMFTHIRNAEEYLQKKNHEKAHSHYKQAISIFKEVSLKPEIRDNVYNHLDKIKEKIVHTSIHNFMKKTKDSVIKEEIEQAKKFHKSLEGIYSHLQRKKEKEFEKISDSLSVERKLDEAFSYLRKNKIKEALGIYNQINDHYSNLKPEEKKVIYPKLLTLYSELSKR